MYIDDGFLIEINTGDRRHRETDACGGNIECVIIFRCDKRRKSALRCQWADGRFFPTLRPTLQRCRCDIPTKNLNAQRLYLEKSPPSPPHTHISNLRLTTLPRIRGIVEHFKSGNATWEYPTSPVGALLICASEAGIGTNFCLHQLRRDFWESAKGLICLRGNEWRRDYLFEGTLERLLTAEQRLARQKYPRNLVWAS